MAGRSFFKILIAVIIVAAIVYYAYGYFAAPAGGMPPQQGAAAPVSVAEVIQRDVQQWHEFSGRMVAIDQAEIRPQVSGIVESVHFSDGALVAKGDLLFTIDPRPYEAAMQSASARADLAESELQRARALLADKALSQHEFDQRKNDAEVAKADLTRAKLDLDYTKIKAPIAGRASRAEITAGNLVETGSGAPLLTTVVSSNPIYADFEIDENTYLQYAQAEAMTLKDVQKIPVMMGLATETGTPHKGHVESFDNRLGNATGTVRARAVFDNKDGLLIPGLFARINLGSTAESQVILITDRAVGTDQNKKFVLVVGDDNKVAYREVTLGQNADGLRVVREGLKPGEKIIVNGLQRARPGSEVKPEVVPMEDNGSDAAPSAAKKESKEKP